MAQERWSVEVNAAEIRRRAQADADLVRYEADVYAARRRQDAEQLVDKARVHLVNAEKQAIAIEQEARRRAEVLVHDTEARARKAAGEIIDGARDWFVAALDRANQRSPDPSVLLIDEQRGDVVIDVRGNAAVPADDILGPSFDQLDRLLQDAVQRAVRRAFRAPTVRAGQYKD